MLGAHLLHFLCSKMADENDQKVRAIYRAASSLRKTERVFSSYGDTLEELGRNIEWVEADLLDTVAIEIAMTGIDQVYHCAAVVDGNLTFDQMKKINVDGTRNMVNLALDAGVSKFCHVSSIATLEAAPGNGIIDEEGEFTIEHLHTDYAISKYGSELEVWRASQEGLNVVILNPGVILGEGLYTSGSGLIISKVDTGMKWYTTGSSGFVYVKDVVIAMTMLMDSDVYNERFIVVSENLKFKPFLEQVATALKSRKPSRRLPKWAAVAVSKLSSTWQILGGRHFLSRSMVQSLYSNTVYDNRKLDNTIDFDYTPIHKALSSIATDYMTDKK